MLDLDKEAVQVVVSVLGAVAASPGVMKRKQKGLYRRLFL
jgi:hypothetical protein